MTRGAAPSTSVRPVRRGPAVALVAAGCALAAVAAGSGPYLTKTRDPQLRLDRLLDATVRERQRRVEGPAPRPPAWWESLFELVLFAVVLIGLLYGLWRLALLLSRLAALRLGASSGGDGTAPYDAGEESHGDAETVLRRRVADELAALSAGLDDSADPREVVIACYARMERAFAEAGAGRAPTESPMELLARVLTDLDVPAADVRRLTALFSEARFSAHPVTAEMRDAARRSLRNVAAALAVPA